MTRLAKTQLDFISDNKVPRDLAFVPYDYVIKHQDDTCEVTTEHAIKLLDMMKAIPHVTLRDKSRVRFLAATVDGSFLFLEVEDTIPGKHFVTSFVDDEDYAMGYMN